jgi:tRNA pseudouridine65 synthase
MAIDDVDRDAAPEGSAEVGGDEAAKKKEPLPIVFADEHYVAIDKPAGLLIHRTSMAKEDDPGDYALQRLRDQLGARVYPVHRLDRPTSGVVIFGRSSEAARRLAAAFEARAVTKRYLAVVRGYAPEAARIDSPVPAREGKDAPKRPALSDLRRLATVELPIAVGRYATARYSLVELRPHSGRWRQLRRHCAHLRHPIVGDTSHGDGRHNQLFRDEFSTRRLLLVAEGLALRHPFSGEALRLRVAPDPALVELFLRLGWTWPALEELDVPDAPGASDREEGARSG